MDFETIILKKEDHIATLTFNRPERRNAANTRMFQELVAALSDINGDDDVRVMVLTGAGNAFQAGSDMKESSGGAERLGAARGLTLEGARQRIRHLPQKVTLGIRNMEKPTIAMINGFAVADGLDWALTCDIRIGSENARFMNAFLRMALFSNTGMTWLLPRIIGLSKACEFFYTTDWLEAEDAYKIGLLNKLVPAAELEKETMAFARKIAEGPPTAIKLFKLQAYKGLEMSLESALELAAYGESNLAHTQDHREALAAFREKRKPVFTGK